MFDTFFENAFKPSIAGIFTVSAVLAPLFGPPVSCLVNVEKDSELRPSDLEVGVIEVGTTLEGFFDEIGEPDQGAVFTLANGEKWRVARTDSNDGEFIKLVVTETA